MLNVNNEDEVCDKFAPIPNIPIWQKKPKLFYQKDG